MAQIKFIGEFQAAYNAFADRMRLQEPHVTVDREWGPATQQAWLKAREYLGWAPKYVDEPMTQDRAERVTALLKRPLALSTPQQWKRGLARRKKRRRDLTVPLRARAATVAEGLVGLMEHGGNNRGAQLEALVRNVGGAIGEPWCGYFVAYCYHLAGKPIADVSQWGYVPWMNRINGAHRTSNPKRGDIVRFNFGHTGIFLRDLGGSIETIEGNTGSSGAVSDSSTGGDGVYKKIRSKGLVYDYLTFD